MVKTVIKPKIEEIIISKDTPKSERIQNARVRMYRWVNRKCMDCGKDISNRGNRSDLCIECQRKKRNKIRNIKRHEFRFNNFLLKVEVGKDEKLFGGEPYEHISSRATKEAGYLDKLCFKSTDEELQVLNSVYKKRFKDDRIKNNQLEYRENVRLIDIVGDHRKLRFQNTMMFYNDDMNPYFECEGTISDEALARIGKEARDRDLQDRLEISELDSENLRWFEKELVTSIEECVDDGFNRSRYTEQINNRLDKCLYVKDGKVIEYDGKDYDETDLRNRIVIDKEGWEMPVDDYEELQRKLKEKNV